MLIFVIFIILIMIIVGTIMLNGVFQFYAEDFTLTMSEILDGDLLKELSGIIGENAHGNFYESLLRERLRTEYGKLGINNSRNLYILDMNGVYRAGTNDELGVELIITSNMLEAMSRNTGDRQFFGENYMDYAVYLRYPAANISQKPDAECIIYIKDTQEQMRNLSWRIFAIIITALLVGLIVAVIMSFFLANAITSPIQSITKRASKLAEGDFTKKIEIASNDEIGTLALTFNDMVDKLEDAFEDVSIEREKLRIYILYLKDGVLVFTDENNRYNYNVNNAINRSNKNNIGNNQNNDGKLILINPSGEEILKNDFNSDNNFADFLNLLNLKDEYEKPENADKYIFRDVAYNENIYDINIGKFKSPQEEGTIVVMHDITQRYVLEKSRREFIANVSHELKSPLTSIRTAAESVLDDRAGAEFKANCMNIILSQSDRMDRIIQDLLIVSRIDNKRMMWQFSYVKPEQMAKNIYETMRGEADKNNQSLILKIVSEIPVIYADRGRIEQVLVNILSNAIRYTPPHGKIEFRLENLESSKNLTNATGNNILGVKFTIKDNGIGIPEEDLPHVFERFYRVEKARSSESGGTGLGLSIAKEMIHAHNGEIMIDSVQGAGTTVTIILPQNSNPQVGEDNEDNNNEDN